MIIGNLQILRACAALAVVFYHLPSFGFIHPSLSPALHQSLVDLGASGVDVFFVLSGFIMAMTVNDRPVNPQRFLTNRLTRIVPLYWLATLALWARFALEPDSDGSVTHLLASLLFVSQPSGHGLPYLLTGWTLEYEMLFYALFAIGLVTPRPYLTTIILICAAVVATGGHFIMFEFLLGLFAFQLYARGISRSLGTALFFVGIGLLCASVLPDLGQSPTESLTGWTRFALWGGPAFLIVLGAATMPAITSPNLVRLGDASYSIYLTHLLIIFTLSPAIDALQLPSLVAQSICFGVCIGFGLAIYLSVEKPIILTFRQRRRVQLQIS